MNRIGTIMVFSLLVILLSSTTLTPVSSVTILLGVKEGDSFIFVIEKFKIESLSNTNIDDGYYLGRDFETRKNIFVKVGEEFTVNIGNTTPYELESFKSQTNLWRIDYNVTYKDKRIIHSISNFTSNIFILPFVSSIDWDNTIPESNKAIAEINENIETDMGLTGGFTIIDTSLEIGLMGSYTEEINEGNRRQRIITNTLHSEMRIDLVTGVLLYTSYKESMKDSERNGVNDYYSLEYVLKQKEYLHPNNAKLEIDLGFELNPVIGFTTIIIVVSVLFTVFAYRRRL